MTRLTSILLVLFLLVAPASAANRYITGTITTNGDIVPLNADDTGNGSIQITGTWTGTVVFETTNGSTWVALTVTPMPVASTVTSATGNGVWTYSGAFKTIRVRATAAITGTATVNIVTTAARAGGSGGAAGPAGTGAVIGDAVTGSTPNTNLYIDAAGKLANTANPTNGQLLCGETGAAPSLCTITAGSNITVTNAAHSITIASTGGSGTGDALTTNPLSQFAATTSAQLAGVLSDETGNSGGTGLAVFSSAPALTNPNLISGTVTTDLAVTASTLWTAVAAPTTPAAGKSRVYVDSSTKQLCNKDDAGTVTCTGGGGTGTVTHTAGALTANLPVIGAGSADVAVGTRSGNTTAFVTTTGTQTNGRCVTIDADGNHVAAAGACGSGGTGTVTNTQASLPAGSMVIGDTSPNIKVDSGCSTDGVGNLTCATVAANGATSGKLTLTNVGGAGKSFMEVVGNPAADLTFTPPVTAPSGTQCRSASASGAAVTEGWTACGGTVTNTGGTLTADVPMFGAGTNDIKVGTKSGSTNTVVTTTGTQTNGRCVEIDANGNHVAAAGACGSGGTGTVTASGSPTDGQIAKFTTGTNIAPSLLSESGSTVTVGSGSAVGAASLGSIIVNGSSSGAVTVQPGAAGAGTYNFNLPVTAGATGSFLTSGGGTSAAMTWTPLQRGIVFEIGAPDGAALTVANTTTAYVTVPFACTLNAYNLLVDAGTITVKFWKVASGTAIPTSSNVINTSGVGIASGTAIHSTTMTDFTTTTVTANDIMAMNVTAVATAKYVSATLQCGQ